MEITIDYLKAQGFKNWNKDEWFKPFKEDWHISIRPTPGNDSWQVSVFKRPTETYGKRSEDLANDNNAMSFTGCITTIEQLELAKRACGIKDKINWREIINALDANLHKSNESGLYYFNKCNILINEACKWLQKNDSYAIPTNVQVDRLREYLNNIK